MNNNDLQSIWHGIHAENRYENRKDVERIIRRKHSKMISKVLTGQRLRILVSSTTFVVYLGLMIYAFVYLGLDLSIHSIIPLTVAGLFLLIKVTSEADRYRVLIKTTDNMSIRESTRFFRETLNKIRMVDFIMNFIVFYMGVIGIIIVFLKDADGMGKEIKSFVIILILIFLCVPWFTRYQYKQRYKQLYADLRDSVSFFDNAS